MTDGPIFDPADLGTCISCGFCLPSCPTYKLTGDEASSPRGRIALMRAIDDGTVDVFDAAAREQGSFCLGCRACEPACPADVPYGRLLETLRDAQWSGRRRPLRVRPLLAFATSNGLIRLAGALRRHARFTPSRDPAKAPSRDPAKALGKRLLGNRLLGKRLLRKLRSRQFKNFSKPSHQVPWGLPPQSRHDGDTLMLGCFERVLFPRVSRAAARTLPGILVARDQGCCGALHAHNGDLARGEHLAEALADRPGRIVSTAGGCAAHLAAVAGRDRVLDYSEALLERGPVPGPIIVDGRPARIGLQDSCHLRNGLGVSAPPRTVLGALGDYVEVPGAADCCGAAGTYAILRRRDSRRVLAAKLAALAHLDLDFLVVVNPGCQRQLMTAVRRARLRTKVVHLAELVDSATAGRR
jgi:glycolate oxidase iron-sulfur subunit